MDIRDLILELKNKNNLTLTEFAKKVGVKPSQVKEWINGKAVPAYKNLKAICTAFNLSGDTILGLK